MNQSELRELLSAEGLRLLDSLPTWHSSDEIVRTVAELRKAGHSPGLVAAVLSQSKLRAKAASKFGPFADRMLFTEAGLEQATRLSVAAQHAGRFSKAGVKWVADLGCGIGADALAIAALEINVTAVERDETTAAIASFNLAPWSNAQVVHGDAETADLAGIDGVYLDPARRDARVRLTNPADWTPSLDFAFGLAERYPTGIKLGPGIDRDLIPDTAEAQWISVGREVVELGLWFGAVARPGIRRAALVIGDHGTAELTAAADSEDEPAGELGQFLYEPDGAVIRARLIGDLARQLNGRMLDTSIAYFSADAAVASPFATCFEIVEDFTLDKRSLKKELAARKIGTLEIKKRGVDIDPATFRTSLSLKGENSATLILTRVAGKRRALLAQRVTPTPA
ncbi:class I SAM-dependent methyltransferase [Salinibacterium sp. NSLL150]|uniref:class I SAM-dependent methyltransferase n=1 Tax=unclassified Salinibacterium TaxID=2632331 RepID=UPI0018CF3DE7|nr:MULTISPECIES: class I SAM-dependent methyltransferase [unclassified Salinibacterium]MBH0098284.1 class I SAM-dependent methyltransferase [Salinibacterium sp. NSLL35]MBH0101039.1 class I SAM-dependent methyltransferase [Salinibacterium sp. NSLL150]MBH0103798.1 class I SAM-dependent methyltransferase [Salinibacterium sp. NSLL16]MBH0106559.1 class I SAM-dependent methyltransferase [Salinibacterium sp. NSLL17]MBH0109676.1 class I SAM-dependent methyltransferase [Salinibacterium sp. NG22]